jgi:DNA replication protein DnaC
MSETVLKKDGISGAKRIGDIMRDSHHYLPEQDIECPVHGIYRGNPYKWSFTGKLDDAPIRYPECPKCEEERKEKEAEEKRQRQQQDQQAHFKNMNIGRRYWETDFFNFSVYTDELKHHLKVAVNFANNPDGKLVMLGENGTGKTHLAVSILKKTGGLIYTAFEIGVMLRQTYNGNSQEWNILKDLCDTKLLIIDEIGRSKGSDWDLNWISHIINTRHVGMTPLILISNRHQKQDCPHGEAGCPKCLENFLDNDVISRITEDGIVLKFTGDDHRRQIGEEYRNQKRVENA